MGHLKITVTSDHTETERTALDDAVDSFTDALRMRGYRGNVEVEWSGDLRRQSINRDGTGGALLERPRRPTSVACPYCGAGAGERCVTASGSATDLHAARKEAAGA